MQKIKMKDVNVITLSGDYNLHIKKVSRKLEKILPKKPAKD